MCKDLMSTQDEWRGILSGEATRNDPTKEKVKLIEIPNHFIFV